MCLEQNYNLMAIGKTLKDEDAFDSVPKELEGKANDINNSVSLECVEAAYTEWTCIRYARYAYLLRVDLLITKLGNDDF